MSDRLNQLATNLEKVLGKRVQSIEIALGEVTVVVNADTYFESAMLLRDDPSLAFEQLIDLCGVDYQEFREGAWGGQRFGVVSHLLSLEHNWRLRVRVFAPDGNAIAHIHLPERCANVCFGGAKNNRLFMAASHSVYALYTNTRGAV